MIYVAVLFIFLFIFSIVYMLCSNVFNKENVIERIKDIDKDYETDVKVLSNKNKESLLKKISLIIFQNKGEENKDSKIKLELIRADMPITEEELLLIKIFLVFIIAFLCLILFKDIIVSVILSIIAWNIPRLIISKRKQKRIKEFDEQLSSGIMIISNSLKSGYSFLQAVNLVTEETKDPFSKEFKKLFKEMSLGISEEDSLKNLLIRVESSDLKLIVNAILIQKDIGGNLSEILDNISETIRERQKIQDELKALTAQGRLSGIIVILIPIFLGIVIYLFNKEYMLLLFTTKLGIIMISVSIISQIFGVIMIKKIINIDL